MNIIEKKVNALVKWIKNDYPVRTIIKGSWVFAKCPYTNIKRKLDEEYATVSLEEMQKFLEEDWTKNLPFKNNTFDCDDFSSVLRGRLLEVGITSVGIADGRQFNGEWRDHWFCIFFDDKLNWYVLEPQLGLLAPAENPVIVGKTYGVNWIIL